MKMSCEEFLRLYNLLKYDDVLLKNTYIMATEKACFVDPVYGEYWARPTEILNGNKKGHPKRKIEHMLKTKRKNNTFKTAKWKGRTPMSADELEIEIQKINPNLQLIKKTYKNKSTKCWFTEKNIGSFLISPQKILQKKQISFPNKKEKTKITFQNKYGGHPMKCSYVREKLIRTKRNRTKSQLLEIK